MISMDKQYRTRNGYPVRILCVDRKHPTRSVRGLVTSLSIELVVSYTSKGKALSASKSREFDLIEVSPWDGFAIDEPVMVRTNTSEEWQRKYFAGVSSRGKPQTWLAGNTSWTSGTCCKRMEFLPPTYKGGTC